MDFGDVLEFVVEMVVVELEGADCFDFLGAGLVDTKGYDLLAVLDAAVLFACGHVWVIFNKIRWFYPDYKLKIYNKIMR